MYASNKLSGFPFFAAAIFLTFAAAGCATADDGSPSGVLRNGETPNQLDAMESLAEDAFDMALGENYAGVSAAAREIDTRWKAFRTQAARDGVNESDLRNMDEAVSDLRRAAANPAEPLSLARAANSVSGEMEILFEVYDPPVPPAILQLDFLGREIALDGMEKNFASASADVDTMVLTWRRLRQTVLDAGGAQAAADYDESITRLQTALLARDANALVEEANDNLELVDALENVFL